MRRNIFYALSEGTPPVRRSCNSSEVATDPETVAKDSLEPRGNPAFNLMSRAQLTAQNMMIQAAKLLQHGVRLPLSLLAIDTFDFRHAPADRISAQHRFLPALTSATTFGTALAVVRDAMLRINCEAVMWKITTRGFTPEEALIMAAMNLLASADAAKHAKRPPQTSSRRYHKETERGI
jgi:hypothetical protein